MYRSLLILAFLSMAIKALAQKKLQVVETPFAFANDRVVYSGTLSKPAGNGPFPLVILVSGMGLQDRDWTFIKGKYQLAKLLTEQLNQQGIAVYRYDDRGHGQSTGTPETLTSFDVLSADLQKAVAAFRGRKDIGKIGLMGHSLGGILSVMTASRNKDIDFVITLAGSYQSGSEVMMEQAATLKRWRTSADMSEMEVVANGQKFVRNWTAYAKGNSAGLDTMKSVLHDLIRFQVRTMSAKDMAENMKVYKDTADMIAKVSEEALGYYTSPHQQSFASYDPITDLEKVACPVLVLFGEKDAHVTIASNLPKVSGVVSGGRLQDITIHLVPAADHSFSTKELIAQGKMVPGLGQYIAGWVTWSR